MGPLGKAVYVLNGGGSSISQYRIAGDGALSPLQPPGVPSVQAPSEMVFSPNGRYAYVTGSHGGIAQYRQGARGELIPLAHPIVPNGGGDFSNVVADPSGRYIGYVSANPQVVAQYIIGPDGELKLHPAALTHNPVGASSFVYGKRGPYVYMVHAARNVISQYRVLPHGGLTPLAPAEVKTTGSLRGITLSPSGRFAYATGYDDGTVLQFRVRPNGTLSPLSPPSVPAGVHPEYVRFDLTGRVAYSINGGSEQSQYRLQPNGTLQPMDPPTVPEGGIDSFILLPHHRSGSAGQPAAHRARPQAARYLYVLNEAAQAVTSYPIDADGTLCSASRRTIATGPSPFEMAAAPGGRYLYVINQGDNTISQYQVGQEGILRPLTPPTAAAGNHPEDLIFHPKEPFVYVVDSGSDEIRRYRIDPNGALQWIASQRLEDVEDPVSMTIDSTGRFAYVASQEGRQGSGISQFRVAPYGPLFPLTPAHLFPSFQPPYEIMSFIRADPVRPLVYLGNNFGVEEYQMQDDGTLQRERSVVGQGKPHCLGFDLARQTAYYPLGAGQVLQYRIEKDGSWVPLPGEYLEEERGPRCAAIDEIGQFAYVTNEQSNTVSEYRIGEDGRLVSLVPAQVPTGEQPTDLVIISVPPGEPAASGDRTRAK
ncbi:MAG TPA: beta-propeller fold lactonase family protein [Armatimonadota bacterium]|nr:beta-propeller fold lactonase family protein [Armatimonadota bacterium]